ncbi:MAG: leucine-rich repeat domain-containing protein [Paludibacteraceae bacterium]|nr:leucine-rich repeat domain-containing protein [Paludibacteraceae bacterium]
MMKKLLVSLLSALLCISVVAEPEIQSDGNQNMNNITIDENGDVFVSPLKYHISSDTTAEVIYDESYKELKSVVIPSKIQIDVFSYPLTSIGELSIKIPSSVTSIGDGAFRDCSGLTSIEIPSSVTSIGGCAFSDCSGLTSIEIPSSVTSIGEWAFYACSGLTHIEIPSSVTNIEKNAFGSCDVLSSINVVSDNSIYSSEDGVLYDKNKRKLICVPAGKNGKFVIPSSVTSIGNYAFMYCRGLTSIEIPSSVTSIENEAFWNCHSLTSIEIPSSVTSIENDVFWNCCGLTSIRIPSSVISIGNYAFSDCRTLTSIKIPSSVINIGVFAFKNCKNLDVIIDNSKENVSVGEDAFDGCKSVKFLK